MTREEFLEVQLETLKKAILLAMKAMPSASEARDELKFKLMLVEEREESWREENK